jgi:hypothetical protein
MRRSSFRRSTWTSFSCRQTGMPLERGAAFTSSCAHRWPTERFRRAHGCPPHGRSRPIWVYRVPPSRRLMNSSRPKVSLSPPRGERRASPVRRLRSRFRVRLGLTGPRLPFPHMVDACRRLRRRYCLSRERAASTFCMEHWRLATFPYCSGGVRTRPNCCAKRIASTTSRPKVTRHCGAHFKAMCDAPAGSFAMPNRFSS